YRCFFFSSRRRHTRFSRDWSSDVCSSDLGGGGPPMLRIWGWRGAASSAATARSGRVLAGDRHQGRAQQLFVEHVALLEDLEHGRSEERRVGKDRTYIMFRLNTQSTHHLLT